jgi:hypothetical protein
MPPKRRRFQRPLGERRYRKLFVIAVEGVKTEFHFRRVVRFLPAFEISSDEGPAVISSCLALHTGTVCGPTGEAENGKAISASTSRLQMIRRLEPT